MRKQAVRISAGISSGMPVPSSDAFQPAALACWSSAHSSASTRPRSSSMVGRRFSTIARICATAASVTAMQSGMRAVAPSAPCSISIRSMRITASDCPVSSSSRAMSCRSCSCAEMSCDERSRNLSFASSRSAFVLRSSAVRSCTSASSERFSRCNSSSARMRSRISARSVSAARRARSVARDHAETPQIALMAAQWRHDHARPDAEPSRRASQPSSEPALGGRGCSVRMGLSCPMSSGT